MLIFWKARLVILAVPKTGTTSIEEVLAPKADTAIRNPPGLKHCTVKKYRRELSKFFEQNGRRKLELCAVMREPEDWLGSWFRYRGRPALEGHDNSTSGKSFEEFIAAHLSEPTPAFAQVGSQANFLEGGTDHLFRYDKQSDLIAFLNDRLGEPVQLPRLNVSPSAKLELSSDLRKRLRSERAADFTLWDKLCSDRPL